MVKVICDSTKEWKEQDEFVVNALKQQYPKITQLLCSKDRESIELGLFLGGSDIFYWFLSYVNGIYYYNTYGLSLYQRHWKAKCDWIEQYNKELDKRKYSVVKQLRIWWKYLRKNIKKCFLNFMN